MQSVLVEGVQSVTALVRPASAQVGVVGNVFRFGLVGFSGAAPRTAPSTTAEASEFDPWDAIDVENLEQSSVETVTVNVCSMNLTGFLKNVDRFQKFAEDVQARQRQGDPHGDARARQMVFGGGLKDICIGATTPQYHGLVVAVFGNQRAHRLRTKS